MSQEGESRRGAGQAQAGAVEGLKREMTAKFRRLPRETQLLLLGRLREMGREAALHDSLYSGPEEEQ